MLGFPHVSLVIRGVKKWMNKNQITIMLFFWVENQKTIMLVV